MGKVTPQTPFIPKKGSQSISKFMKQIRTEKISMRLHMPWLRVMTGLKKTKTKTKKENRENRKIY